MKAGQSGRPADAAQGARLPEFVRVRGAREHNLKSVDLNIPRDARVVVFTMVPGRARRRSQMVCCWAARDKCSRQGRAAGLPASPAGRGISWVSAGRSGSSQKRRRVSPVLTT
jgi:hypothetical protein